MSDSRLRILSWLAFFIIPAILLVAIWPALSGPFLFDDFPNLAALTSIDHVSSWRDLGIYLSQPRSFPGRPLAMLSFLAQKSSWPGDPFAFKLVNTIIHLINGFLVYRLTWVLCQLRRPHEESEEAASALLSRAKIASLIAMAAWLLNPIQITPVQLVVQRMTLLMAFFVLLGLLVYLKAIRDESASSLRRGTWMLLGLGICMGLAFLSKENGILLPLFALVLDVTVLRDAVARLQGGLKWWRRLLIWPVCAFIFGYLIYAAWQGWGIYGIRDFTVGERLLTEPRILFDYLNKIFLPHFGAYGLFHDGFPVSHGLFTPLTTALALSTLLAAVIFGWCVRKRWPLVALGILFYLAGQVIESSSLMLELYFEHRNYVPIIGPFVAIAIGIAWISNPRHRKILIGIFLVWLAACAFTLALSAKVFSSADRLATVWAYNQPDSIRAQNMLAGQYAQHGNLHQSLKILESALGKHPDSAVLLENRITIKCLLQSLDPADVSQAIEQLRSAPFDRTGVHTIESLRGFANKGTCAALTPEKWRTMVDVMLANPNFSNGVAQGFLHFQLHEQAVTQGNLDAAIAQLDAAYRNDPDAEIPRLQAKYLASAGLYDAAIKQLEDTDYGKLPLLRRLLVNDHAINAHAIKILEQQQAAAKQPGPSHS